MRNRPAVQKFLRILVFCLALGLWAPDASAFGFFSSDKNKAFWQDSRELEWDDLIPAGVPYGEIVSDGEIDTENDVWKPGYDNNSYKLVDELNGQLVRLPAFVVPLEYSGDGVISFLAVPFYGACIHTPPPPPNQIVYVTLDEPQRFDDPYQPYWILGNIATNLVETELAFTGYTLKAQDMRFYEIELPEME